MEKKKYQKPTMKVIQKEKVPAAALAELESKRKKIVKFIKKGQ